MTTDLVWIVGGEPDGPGREEMRYSLRSVAANVRFDYRDVVAVGDPPDWFAGVRIPLEPVADKWGNQRQSLAAYLNHPGAAETVIVLNDDMYVTEPIDHLPVVRNKARSSAWASDHERHSMSCWTCAVKACAEWVRAEVGGDIWLYESHTPLPFNTARLRDLINRYPVDLPWMLGEMYPLAGAGDEGAPLGNAKVKRESLAEKLALPMPYLSGSPASWPGPLGEWARDQWPTPCRWELEWHHASGSGTGTAGASSPDA